MNNLERASLPSPEFSGSLEHAEVMFDSLVGADARYSVHWDSRHYPHMLSIWLMLPPHRKGAFVDGQTFYGVGVRCRANGGQWYWAEEVRVNGPRTWSDIYGSYLDITFISHGQVWRGKDPERLEKLVTTLVA